MKRKEVTIIGGGASGIIAAITAARLGAKVTIIEQKEMLGKKLLSTGNGRCNLTNEHMTKECFHSEQADMISTVLGIFDASSTVEFFHKLGILTKSRNGYIYPLSDQASAILEVLLIELKRLQVTIILSTKVISITSKKNIFFIVTEKKAFQCAYVILATGGCAASVLGSDGSGYLLSKQLGHSLTPVVPALVQLRCLGKFFKKIAGVRVDAKVTALLSNGKKVDDTGEVQLTNYGISGIPVFQISRFVALELQKNKTVPVIIDFLPTFSMDNFFSLLEDKIQCLPTKTIAEQLVGIFNCKLIPLFLEKSNIFNQKISSELSNKELRDLVNCCKNFEVVVTTTNPFEQAQVCAGGVKTTEVNSNTMESKIKKGLYLTGELLDVDGMCGGYNLQWAWATGFIAGKNVGELK